MPSVSRHFSVRTCSQHDADLTTLQQISQQTFLETFADVNSTFCFLEADTNVIGYLKINIGSAQTENKYERSLEIERIYVLGSYQGQGTGKILLDHALEMARSMHAEFVWLGVWEHNHRAIGFYRKHGFVEFSRHVFRLGDDEQIDILMRISLHPDPAG